jgi:RecA-family ATPase
MTDPIREEIDGIKPPRPANGHDPNLLGLVDPSTLQGKMVPERQWLVGDWIPMVRATSLYGAGGEGKTLLAQMLATSCAIGALWLGLRVRKCNSILQFCEDDLDEMHRRQEDINNHLGCTFADLRAMRWLPRLGEDNVLMTFDSGRPIRTPLFDQLLTATKDHNAGLAISDTLADVFSGNENDRGQARAFGQSVPGYIARETGAAFLALAHPSLTGMANGSTGSGSTTWRGTFKSQLYLETPKADEGEQLDPDIRMLRRAKANYARRNETIELRWKNGVFVPTTPTGIIASIERRTAEQVFLDLLADLLGQDRHVSHGPRTGNYAPKIFAQQRTLERFQQPDFERAMHALFGQKKIKIGSYIGPNRHPHECIVLAN